MAAVIDVQGLTKRYGAVEAVKGIDFQVGAGEVFGLLGPNGAGKTSTVEILEGLRPRTGGKVSVLGFDPGLQSRQLRDRIGVSLQATHLSDKLKVREAVEVFAAMYSRSVDPGQLLSRLKLGEKREAYYADLSGGQKQRLALALALVNEPQVVFLDEPTAGLDPQVRHEIHDLIEGLRREQRTVLLTTHYIEEAEKLCDRIAIIDGGRIIALGTPREISGRASGQSVIEFSFESPLPPGGDPPAGEEDQLSVGADRRSVKLVSSRPTRALVGVMKWLDQHGIEVSDLQMKRPTLEDAFIELTGRRIRD